MKVLRVVPCVLLVRASCTAYGRRPGGTLDSIYQQLIKHDASMFPRGDLVGHGRPGDP